jgi:hypothetical protein
MSRSRRAVPKELIRIGILMHPAIAGASFAAVIQLASRESLGQAAIASIVCFAIALPASIAMVFISQLVIPEGTEIGEASQATEKRMPLLPYLVSLAEQISFFVGVLALLWSLHPAASVVFLAVTVVAFLAVNQVERMR